MSKKVKDPEKIIRDSLTGAFFRYHLNKMSLAEFIIRFLKIDLVNKGTTSEKLELLKIIRNYQRGIKEDCDCPPEIIKKPRTYKFFTRKKDEIEKF